MIDLLSRLFLNWSYEFFLWTHQNLILHQNFIDSLIRYCSVIFWYWSQRIFRKESFIRRWHFYFSKNSVRFSIWHYFIILVMICQTNVWSLNSNWLSMNFVLLMNLLISFQIDIWIVLLICFLVDQIELWINEISIREYFQIIS